MAFQRRGWRYFATRLNGDGTETMISNDLPIEDVTIEDVLSGTGSLTGKIEPVYTKLLARDGFPVLRNYSTAIYAEADGVLRAGGIITNIDPDGPTLSLEATGFLGYARDLPYTGPGYAGVEVDPLDVARAIWSHIQGQPGGNIGLRLGTQKVGIKIGTVLQQVEFDTQDGPVSFEAGPVKMNYYDTHDLLGLFEDIASGKYVKTQIPAGQSGIFDYHERHGWLGEEIQHYVDFGVPTIGRTRDDLRFVFGVNIFEPPSISMPGEIYASGALVLGSGDGPTIKHGLVEPMRQPGDPLRRVAVIEASNLSSDSACVTRAQQEVQWRRRLEDIDAVTVVDHPNARLGAAQVGDTIRLEVRQDWMETTMTVRILSITYQPANGKVAEYKVARTDKLTS